MSTESVMPRTPFSSCPQSFPSSGPFAVSRLFTSGGQRIGASASASDSSEYSGLISFRIDWFDFLAVQGTLKSLLQHHSSKTLILWCSVFLMVSTYIIISGEIIFSYIELESLQVPRYMYSQRSGFWHQIYFGLRVPAPINVTLGYHLVSSALTAVNTSSNSREDEMIKFT